MAKGNTIGQKIRRIRQRFSKRQKITGFLYRGALPSTRKKFKQITVFAIFVSNEGGVFLRDHAFAFASGSGRSRGDWKRWLDDNYGTIITQHILPKYQEKFGGFWRLHTMIGWTGHVNKRAGNTLSSKTWNKSKRKRK